MGTFSTMGMIQVVTVCTFLPTVPCNILLFLHVDVVHRVGGTADAGNSEGVVGVRNGRHFGTFAFENGNCKNSLAGTVRVCNTSRDCRSCVAS